MAKSKNIKKIQDMLMGKSGKSIQVSMADDTSVHANRKVGDKWFDAEGDQWEQMNGYRSKVSHVQKGLGDTCSECKKFIFKGNDRDTWNRMGRCYYCQIDFEAKLKTQKIGKNGNKWLFWVKQQALQRWQAMDSEAESIIFERHEENKTLWDRSVANAIANDNIAKQRGN